MATVDELILRVKVENEGGSSFKDMLSDVKNLGAAGASAFTGMASAATSFAATMAKDVVSSTVSFGKDAIVKLADFRAEMAGVGKTTGLTGEELDKLGKDLRDLSLDQLKGNVAAEDLAKIAAGAGQLGVATKDIKAFTKDVAEISIATDLSAEETATSMAQIANQFKTSLEQPRIYFDEFGKSIGTASKSAFEQIGNIGSAINQMANTTTAEAPALIDMTNRIAGIGTVAGLTVSDVVALGATMVDAGIGVEKGSTAMNKMLGELMKNSDAFAKTLKLDSKELADALAKDPMKAIEMVLKGMDDMGKSEGPKAMLLAVEGLLGKGDGITALATKLSAKYADLSKNAADSADAFMKGTSAHDEFMAQTSHTEARWAALGEKMNEFSRRVAELFEPITNWVTEALNSVADIVLENFDVIGNYVSGFVESVKTKLMDIFGPQVMAAFEKGDLINGFKGIYEQLSTMFQNSPFAFLWDGAKAGLVALKEEFVIFGTFVKDVFTKLMTGDFQGAFDAVIKGLQGSLGVIGKMISDTFSSSALLSPFADGLKVVTTAVSNELGILSKMITDSVQAIKEGNYEGVFDNLMKGLSASIQNVQQMYIDLLTQVQEFNNGVAKSFKDSPLEPFIKDIMALLNNIIGIFKTLIGMNKEMYGTMGDTGVAKGGLMVLIAMLGTVAGWINKIIEGYKQIGTLSGEIVAGDITAKDITGAIGIMFDDLWNWIKGGFTSFWKWLKESFSGVGDSIIEPIKDAFTAVWEWIKEKFSGLADLVLGPINTIKDKVSSVLSSVSNTVSGLFSDAEEEVKATTAEVENLTAATNAATAATAELGTEALYQSVYPDLIAALKTTTDQTDRLTGSIWETTAAVNKLGVDAIYQSVFPDLTEAVSESAATTDALTDSISQATDAAYDLSQTNPTDGWNSAIKSTVSELANAKRALSETAVLSTSSGSTITTTRRLSEGQVASQVESAIASNSSSSSGKSLVNRNVTIQFNGTNVVDESSKARFARDVATAIASINAQTVRG